MPQFQLDVNGMAVTATADDPAMPLLYFLRNDLGLHGPRFGCGLGQCGACKVTTLEGLGSNENLHPLQRAFIEEQAVQCGYCINGMIMQAAAFLKRTPKPTEEQVRQELRPNLCRCGTHIRIVRAVMRASQA
jgi:nicotinate dehydrogenase subunit A